MSINQTQNSNQNRHKLVIYGYWGKRVLSQIYLTPVRITFVYLLFGFLGLFVSDVLFVQYFSEPLLSQIQALKGGVEVVLTAGLILALTTQRETRYQENVDRLDHQREELQVLHRVLRHNLRNDLNVIMGYTEQIRNRVSVDQIDPECTKIFETIEKINHYTDQAVRINQITEQNGHVQTINLAATIPRLLDDHPLVSSEIDVSTVIPDHATIEANRIFETALIEVITNAIVHNDAETPTITIKVDPNRGPPHMLEIWVSDNGPGIPPTELNPLRAGKEEQVFHLSGMGLWLVKWTVQESGGKLIFQTNEQGGTTARIQVPKATGMLFPSLFS